MVTTSSLLEFSVVLLDLSMPILDGVLSTRLVQRLFSHFS